MSYIDLILIVVIVIIGLRGFYNGFVNEIAGVLGIVLGVFFASRFAPDMANWFTNNVYAISSHSIAVLIGFVIILAIIWVGFLILGIFLSKFIKISDFLIVDKTLGFIFSCCKIFLILGFIFYAISKPEFMKSFNIYMQENSKLYATMNVLSKHIMKLESVQETAKNAQNIISQPASQAIQPAQEKLQQKAQEKLQEKFNEATDKIQDNLKDNLKDSLKKPFESNPSNPENLDSQPKNEDN